MLKNFKTFELSVKFYRECEKLRLPVHLKNQLSKASSSVSLNLAEGSGKPTNKDQLRFYYIAMGSLRECQSILVLANLNKNNSYKIADCLGASLYRLIQSRMQ